MTFIILLPELILFIGLLIYGFILGSSSIKILNDRLVNTYVFFTLNLSVLLWLFFLIFIPDNVFLSFNVASNKLFIIFKFYIVFTVLFFYITNIKNFNIFKSFLLTSLTLACFILISFSNDLIYFIGFILLIASLIGFLISNNIKESIIFNLFPLIFILLLLLTYSNNNILLMFVLFSLTLLSYFVKNKEIHYLINAILFPILFFYLIKNYITLDVLFFKSNLLFGIVLLVFSTIFTFSKNFSSNKFYYLIMNYLAHIFILIGVNSFPAIVLALLLIVLIPLLLKDNFISSITLTMTPSSPLFIFKLVFLVIVFNYSIFIFFIIASLYPVLLINSLKKINKLKLNLANKILFIYIFILFLSTTLFFNELLMIVRKVTF